VNTNDNDKNEIENGNDNDNDNDNPNKLRKSLDNNRKKKLSNLIRWCRNK